MLAFNIIDENHYNPYNIVINHFKNLYNTMPPPNYDYNCIPTGDVILTHLTDLLIDPVLDDEIKNAIFAAPKGSSPGPDGFSIKFCKDNWHIIGYRVFSIVRYFFCTGYLPKGVKATVITIFPKNVIIMVLLITGL